MKEFIKKHALFTIIIPLFIGSVFASIGVFYISDYLHVTEGNFNNKESIESTILLSLIIGFSGIIPGLIALYRLKKTSKRTK